MTIALIFYDTERQTNWGIGQMSFKINLLREGDGGPENKPH
jgi:hypothetical protein